MRRVCVWLLTVCLLWSSVAGSVTAANGNDSPIRADIVSEPLAPFALNRPVLDAVPPLTNRHELTFTGTSMPASTVQLYFRIAGSGEYEYYAGEAETSESGGFEIPAYINEEGVYTFFARAVLDDQTSENSEPAVIEFDFTPPASPEDVYAEVTHDSVQIYWSSPIIYDPNAGHHVPDLTVDRYEIHKENGEVIPLGKDASSYSDEGLTPETLFRYVLYAVDAAGNRSLAARVSAVTRHQYLTVIADAESYLYDTVISADGRWIAYRSISPDGPGVFLYNRDTGDKTEIGPGRSVSWDKGLGISADGRHVLQQQSEGNIGGARQYSLQLYDRSDDSTVQIVTSNQSFESIGLSDDGTRVVFSSYDDHIPAANHPGNSDVFLAIRDDNGNWTIQCLSYRPDSALEAGDSRESHINGTGTYVVFESNSKALADGEAPTDDSFSRIYLYDIQGQTRSVIRIMESGEEWIARMPTISPDGDLIAYTAIRGTDIQVEERLTAIYSRSAGKSVVIHRLPGNTDISFGKPHIRFNPGHQPAGANIHVIQEYTNYNPEAGEAPFLSQHGVMYYTVSDRIFQGDDVAPIKRNLISNNGYNAREGRLNGDGTAAVFRDGTTGVPGRAVYYVCLQNCTAEQPPIESAAWSVPADAKVQGEVKRGSDITVQATGQTGRQLEAYITYKRFGEANPAGEDEASMTLPVPELSYGTYRMSFPVPERAAEIVSIVVRTTDRAHERLTGDVPIRVAGTLRIKLDAERPGMLDRTEIAIARPGMDLVTIPVQQTVSSYEADLPSGGDYSVILRKLDGLVLARQDDVQIGNGREREITLRMFGIYSFYLLGELLYNRYVDPGQTLSLLAVGDEGADVEAEVTYTTADGREKLRVPLHASGAPTRYEGSFQVPQAATDVVSITAAASRGGMSASAEALRQPLVVTGALEIRIGNAADIRGYKLKAHSDSLGIAKNIGLDDYTPSNPVLTATGLAPAPDYRFTLLDRNGGNWLEDSASGHAVVEPGRTGTVTLEPTQPASITVRVIAEDTREGYVSDVVISDGTTSYTRTPQDGTAVFGYVKSMIGKRVTISTTPTDGLYLPGEAVINELAPGVTDVELVVKRKSRAYITGIVKHEDDKPVHGATVRVTMNKFAAEVKTAEDGSYSLEAPAGLATISASFRNMSILEGSRKVTLQAGENPMPTLVLWKPKIATIDVRLFTKYTDGDWVGPHDIDWRTAVHYRISADHPIIKNSRPFTVSATSGETVRVCVDGVESGLPAACGTAVIGEDMRGTAEIRLAQFEGKVAAEMFPFQGNGQKQLYLVESNGRRKQISTTALSPGEFVQILPGDGTYEYWFYVNGRLTAKRQFQAIEGDTVQLGPITANPSPMFSGYSGNEVTAGGNEAVPGSRVQIRAAYRNGAAATARQAKLWLDMPADSEVAEGSVVWNGEPVLPQQDGDRLYIALGDIEAGDAGTVYYTLQFGSSEESSPAAIAPGLTHEQNGNVAEEWLGSVQLLRPGVTLTAPAFATQRAVHVTGMAPPESTVYVYDRSELLGEALAGPNGNWSLTVEKAGESPIYTYLLKAEATRSDEIWFSNTAAVRVDSHYPEPVAFVMQQSDGRKITIDPRASGNKFPYVHAPGFPYHLSVEFNHPDRVRNVRFVVGESEWPAYRMADGSFVVNTVIPQVGAIGVDFDIVESTESIGSYIESEEERIAALPPLFQEPEDMEVEVSPPTDGGNRQSASYRTVVPTADGSGADYRMNASFERKMYTPSESDLSRAEELGIPVYGAQMSYSFRGGRLYIELSGYIPEGAFEQAAQGKAISAASASAGLAVGQAVSAIAARFSANIGAKAGDAAWIGITNSFTLYDGRSGMSGILDAMGDLLDDVSLNCTPEAYRKYKEDLDSLYTKLIVNEVMKAGIALAGAVMGPATFGIGTVALFIVSAAYGKLLDAEAEGQFVKIKNRVNSDSKCKPQKKPRKPKKDLANPVWIHDPSGYVYEVEPSNRIRDVKATALNWNEATARWEVWDADWFGQQNPLYTNSEGRYGWDVPEGKWKVLYEKDGYLPGESWEMTVLPPHFDVNVGLVSTLPPKVAGVSAAPGGEYVQVLFDRHVRDSSVNPLTVRLIDSEDRQPVYGELTLGDAVAYEGRQVSRVVRFTPDAPLELGAEYEVYVDESVQSYNGIAMEKGYRAVIEVADSDVTPPLPVSELAVTADGTSLIASWTEGFDPDLDRLELHVKRTDDRTGDEVQVYEVAKGERWVMAQGLRHGSAYEIEVHALDAAGNRSITRADAATGLAQTAGPDIVPPSAPGSVTATTAEGGIRVAWSDPDDEDLDHIVVAWQRAGQTEGGQSENVRKGAQAKLIGSLTGGASYDIHVYAVDRSGLVSDRVTVQAVAGQSTGGGGPVGGGPGQPGKGPVEPDADTETLHLEPGRGTYSLLGEEVKLTLRDGALRTEARLVAERLPKPAAAGAGTGTGTLRPVSPAYKLMLEGVRFFEKRGVLELVYDAASLKGADVRKLGIYRLDDESGDWVYVGGMAADAGAATVAGGFLTSGTYAVMLNEVAFEDMKKHWATEAVELLATWGLVSGAAPGQFVPDRAVTRAEFAKLAVGMVRSLRDRADIADGLNGAGGASGAGSVNGAGGVNGADSATGTGSVNGANGANSAGEITLPTVFSDVPENAWYASVVREASAMGLMQGAYGQFRPDDAVTREEMMAVIARALGFDPASKLNAEAILAGYNDGGEISDWARASAAYLIRSGLIEGAYGRLEPQGSATRAQTAAVLLRVLEQGKL